MASRVLYPPIIADYVPTFVGSETSGSINIPFSLSKFNVSTDINSLHVTITKQSNGASVVNDVDDVNNNRYRRNGKIILNVGFDSVKERDENGRDVDTGVKYFTLDYNDIYKGWVPGTIYKVQIRLSEISYSPGAGGINDQFDQLNNSDNASKFSEQSTVCIIKATSKIDLDIGYPFLYNSKNSDVTGEQVNTEDVKTYPEATIDFYGRIITEDSSEKLYSYNIKLYHYINEVSQLIEDSGTIFSNKYQDSNEFLYSFKKEFQDQEKYEVLFVYKTINEYTGEYRQIFTIDYSRASAPEMRIITAEDGEINIDHKHHFNQESPGYSGGATSESSGSDTSAEEIIGFTSIIQEEEDGRIGIRLQPTSSQEKFSGNFCIRRTDERSNFEDQTDLTILVLKDESILDINTYYDYLIESGVYYKYAVQEIDRNGRRSLMREISKPIMRDFYYSFLLGENQQQLKLKFDNTMQSFKIQQIESKLEPIGSKYAKVTRNAAIEYKTFPIAGLISFQMDDNKLFTDKLKIYGENNRYHTHEGMYDYIYERDFRNEVLKFLQNGKPKLFKSPTEGNILVRLMDVNCTPNQTLDRMLYSFTSNAIELAEANMENYLKYNFYEVGTQTSDFSVNGTALGQLASPMKFKPIVNGDSTGATNIIKEIYNKYQILTQNIGGYIRKITGIYQIRITINDPSQRVTHKGVPILGHKIRVVGGAGINTTEIVIYNGIYDFDSRIVFTDETQGIYFVSDTADEISANIDFVYDYVLEQYLGKKEINLSTVRGLGQVFNNYRPEDSIYTDIRGKYYLNTDTDFCHLKTLSSILIEADPGCVFAIQDEVDREAGPAQYHEIGVTGVLSLQELSNIREIIYVGKRKLVQNEETEKYESQLITDRNEIATVSVTYYYTLSKGNYETETTTI